MSFVLSVRVLDSGDGHDLESMRIQSYRDQYGLDVDSTALNWNPNLSHTLDLGLFEGQELVSAFRIDCINTVEAAEFALQVRLDRHPELRELRFPLAIGCRACTRVDRQSLGYRYILRFIAIQILRELNVPFLASTFAADSRWASTLKQAGYTVFESEKQWSDFLVSKSLPLVAVLNLEQAGERALGILAKKVPEALLIGDKTVEAARWGAECIRSFGRTQEWARNFISNNARIQFERIEIDTEKKMKIVKLRQAEFAYKYRNDVAIEGLEWNDADSKSIHFGAWTDDQLISTIRLTEVKEPSQYREIMLMDPQNPFVSIPCSVLARAATDRRYSGQNLSMRLRAFAYRYWLTQMSEEFLYGTALASSKRLSVLREWGYEFVENSPWTGYLKSKEDGVSVFRISRSNLEKSFPVILNQCWGIGTVQADSNLGVN